MTPEERAEKLASWLWDEAGIATNGLTQKVAEAIREAEAVERDQCAAIAIRMHGSDGDAIAEAIRART